MTTAGTHDDELDLPPLDGESELDEPAALHEEISTEDDGGDALDDATAEEAAPVDDLIRVEQEHGWLVDADSATTLELGPADVGLAEEGTPHVEDERELDVHLGHDMLDDEAVIADGGEEGPIAEDEELREEDLPLLDADEDGDVDDADLFDRTALGNEEELRWADRAWERDPNLDVAEDDPIDDSGALAVPGDDVHHAERDATWKRLEETGRVMAATFVSGGAVVLALATADRARGLLVRIQLDGAASIVAEIEPTKGEDDGEACRVLALRWDVARGRLAAFGSFGVQAFRPSARPA